MHRADPAVAAAPEWQARLGRATIWCAVVAALAALYVWSYSACLWRFFYLDDFWELKAAADMQIHSLHDLWQFFRPIPSFLLYRPVSTVMYFYALRQAFGHDPVLYHATQLAFHIVNAALVYGVAKRIFVASWPALLVAIVYATAPGHALAVYWMALFTMTGTAFFYLLALWIWLGPDGNWRVRGTFLLFIIALLASEHAISLPLVLSLAELLVRQRRNWRVMLREQAAFYVVAGAYVAIKLVHMGKIASTGSLGVYAISLNPYLLLQNVGRYAGFGIDALYPLHGAERAAAMAGVGIIALALGLTVVAVVRRDSPMAVRVASFGVDLFLLALGPVIVLPNHVQPYYVGIAASGAGLVAGAASCALARFRDAVAACSIVLFLAVHVFYTAPRHQQTFNFMLLIGGSDLSAAWLQRLATMPDARQVEEVVVPRDPVTEMVFDNDAQRVLLCAGYRVRLSDHLDTESPGPGRIVMGPMAWQPQARDFRPRWEWLPRRCETRRRGPGSDQVT